MSEESKQRENGANATSGITKVEKLTYIKEFRTKIKSDSTEPWIVGMVCMSDGKIIVLDKENVKLKLFNEDFTFCSELITERKGSGITAISEQEVAVTCGNEIHFFVVNGNSITQLKKTFELNGLGYGITYEGSNYAVTLGTTVGPRSLEFLDENGHAKWVIKERNEVGKDLDIPKYVAMDTEKQLYIANSNEHVVQCLSCKHELLWEVDVSGGPKGVCVFKNSLLVVCFYSRTVYQISSKGEIINKISIDGENVEHPEIISYQESTNRFLISCYDEDRVWVFDAN